VAPKVEAAAGFADFDGTTLIGSLDQVDDLLAGRAGTVVVPQAQVP
jgi:carbamate kinase